MILEVPEMIINITFHKQVEEYEQKIYQPFLRLHPEIPASVYLTRL